MIYVGEMETDIEIELYNGFHNKGQFDALSQNIIGNYYMYHYNDETISYFNRYCKGKKHGPEYRFHIERKELRSISKFNYGKYHGTCICKVYKEDGCESDMLEVIIHKNDKLVKEMKRRIVLD